MTKEEALGRLEVLCGRSEQCESDLTRTLINWGISSCDRKEILYYLKENRYLDDARFARSFANDKARFSSWGPYKIRMELIRKRISSPLIREAVNNVESEIWKEGLLRCARAKAKNLDLTGEDSFEECQKLFRYLVGRGFPSGAVSKAVNVMRKRQETDEVD